MSLQGALPVAMVLAAGHLGRHERRRAADRARGGGAERPRAPEVGQLGAPVAPDQHVPRLDVAVHDGAVVVEVRQRAQHVRGVGTDGALLERAPIPGHLVGERPAGGVLEEELVRPFLRAVAAADAAHDVGRGQPGQHRSLPPQRRRVAGAS
jgi:hypothetical protein